MDIVLSGTIVSFLKISIQFESSALGMVSLVFAIEQLI